MLSNQYFINNAIVITTNVIIQQVYVTYNAKTRFTINIKILKNKLNQFNDNLGFFTQINHAPNMNSEKGTEKYASIGAAIRRSIVEKIISATL